MMSSINSTPDGPENIAALIAAHRARIDHVLVGGGDGTMNRALPGSPAATGLYAPSAPHTPGSYDTVDDASTRASVNEEPRVEGARPRCRRWAS